MEEGLVFRVGAGAACLHTLSDLRRESTSREGANSIPVLRCPGLSHSKDTPTLPQPKATDGPTSARMQRPQFDYFPADFRTRRSRVRIFRTQVTRKLAILDSQQDDV